MLAAATALGCPPKNGQPDALCLCANVEFANGIRDCVTQSCPAGTNTTEIIAFGVAYCNAGKHSGHDAIMANSTRKLKPPFPYSRCQCFWCSKLRHHDLH